MRANRPELAVLRGKRSPQALSLWAEHFARGNQRKAKRYALAVASFLGDAREDQEDYFGQFSPNTRAVYAYAVTEFFEWVAAKHGKVLPPEEVTRVDAEGYVTWLANRTFSLAEEKLKDGDQPELLELFEIVQQKGIASLDDIMAELPESRSRKDVSRLVRELVTKDVVTSDPTLAELRKEFPLAGISQWEIPDGKELVPLEDVFAYSVRQYPGVSRTTTAQRVSALSTFWSILMQGENVEGGEPLLQYNVWNGVKRRVSRGLSAYKTEAARKQRMPSDNVIRMLRDAPVKTMVQLRNKAMLYLMVFAGVRTTEMLRLRRSRPPSGSWKAWFDGGEQPTLHLLRKGNKWQRLPYPPAALKPLIEFQHLLERSAASVDAQSDDPEAPNFLDADDAGWYYRDLLLPDAPLFPSLVFWGKNRGAKTDYRTSMTRIQCYRLLKRIGTEVGLDPSEVARIHPHALRHFSATAMLEGGKDIREVQAILGHASLQTTEGYLEDVEASTRLSGQEAILEYLDVRQGRPVEPIHVPGRVDREVVEVRGVGVPEETDVEVTPEEVQVLEALMEELPEHDMPQPPQDYDPEVVAMAMPGDQPPVLETDEGLVGVDGDRPAEEILEDTTQMVRDGQSPGSPAWVYEAMANPRGLHETVVFNRGGERDREWLEEHYSKMPTNFGVGHESYLPWYVRARGNITRGGYFKKRAPFPVLSPEQCNPETSVGEQFMARIEQAYSMFVHGDVERGVSPSPLRSIGLVRWYSFFVYHGTRFQDESGLDWQPWNTVVDLGQVRCHQDIWLVQWLVENAHTFRASVDSMKRGVSRTSEDPTDTFLRSSFEGVELITEVPDWMAYDDPVQQLYEDDPAQWGEMINWLKDVTGQQLEPARQQDRQEQLADADEEQKTQARVIRDILVSVVKLVDQLSKAKRVAKERILDLRGQLRTQLYWYATAAGGVDRLSTSLDALKQMSTKDFNEEMAEIYGRLGVPDPNGPEYRSLRGKARVAAIVAALFPTLPQLTDGNVFADSKLFNPRWFRIDEEEHTVYIEASERQALIRQFGQDPELLVRRATRAMWESREKGYEALWGVMMSYFSWIIPTGREMESEVLGIPVAELGAEDLNVEARKNWLKAWSRQMMRLARGQGLEADETLPEPVVEEEGLTPWERFLREEEEKETGFREIPMGLGASASEGLDLALTSSVFGGTESAEEMWVSAEDAEERRKEARRRLVEAGYDPEQYAEYLENPTSRGLIRNGRATVAHLEGEKPTRWYKVDLFGRQLKRYRPNAPPMFVSPGVVYRTQKRTFAARQLLPSPFRMVSGMDLES